jgi:hypothetical protein
MEREMFTIRKSVIATVAAAAIALTSFGAAPAHAGYRRGDAVAAAAIAGVFGTVAAVIAAKSARDRYNAYYGPRPYGYRAPHGYGASYGYGAPYAYGAPAYYGRPFHSGPRWGGWHRRYW